MILMYDNKKPSMVPFGSIATGDNYKKIMRAIIHK